MKNIFAERPVICLTPRDIEILKWIHSEGSKTSTDIHERFWNGKSKKANAGFQRTRKLIEGGFIERGNPKLLYLSDEAKKRLKMQSVEGEICHA